MIKTKSSNDYSLWQVGLGFVGLVCWSLYIFTSKQSIIVYIGTVIDLILEFLVVGLILSFFDFKKKVSNPLVIGLVCTVGAYFCSSLFGLTFFYTAPFFYMIYGMATSVLKRA